MTGRARGRARGRSRGGPPLETRRPGEPQQQAPAPTQQQVQVGRGSRGRGAGAQQAKPPTPPSQQQQPQPPKQEVPTEGLAAMTVTPKEPSPPTPAAATGRGGRGRGGPEPATRPEHIKDKRGTTGRTINVMSNYVTLKSRPNCALYQYNVSYSPPIENKRLRVALLYSYDGIGQTKAFDGMILYLPHKLPDQVTKYLTKTQRDQTPVEVTITLTNELSADSPICLQLFNIIFRRILYNLEMIQIGRHYFYNKRPIPVPAHRMELWPGFITSILQYERNILLSLDISHKILRTDTVFDFMKEVYNSGRSDFHDQITKGLVGEIVLTRYNNKTYRIDDIDFDKNPKTKFKTRDGSEISFIDYYKKTYDKDIFDANQPLIVSNPKMRDIRARGGDDSPIMLIPELCTRTGLSDEARADFRVMKDLGEHTRIAPQVRRQRCLQFISDMKKNPKCAAELDGWNLDFDDNLIRYPARVLTQEKIFQKGGEVSYRAHEADWSRDMRGKALVTPVPLNDFFIISTARDADKARDFLLTLQKVCPAMGIQVNGKCPTLQASNDRTDTFLSMIKSNLKPSTQMVIVILPTNRKDRYDSIKKVCCYTHPVPSQCILARTLSKKQMIMSVTTKVAMQINCKLGGELWALEIPIKNMMVIGIDTYHDSAKKGRSVMGFIASTNNSLTRYYSQCAFQGLGQELADNLKTCIISALKKYGQINRMLPDRIIIFRDGVGDGQLAAVYEHEIKQITNGFREINDGTYTPKFSVVVVKKRINTRIFHEDRGELKNPPPGTVVDTEVTQPQWYDYFIVSQSVRQGTVTPTHFNVIHDGAGLKPDHMQRLTYKLCHLYYNWPGTVRVPAPCQYAHKLAFLVGQSIHEKPSVELSDKLYYL